jgi:CRP/FNR family transcriptional regulator
MAMVRSLAAMVRATNDQLADVLALDVSARLAKWLLAQAGETDRVVLAETQESLGVRLGTTRVTVNRTLHRFERLGLIRIEGVGIAIVDRAALEVIGEG